MSLSTGKISILLGGLFATFLLSAGAALVLRSGLAYPCPFKFLFEIPCCTCGTTRSLAALAALDFVGAIRFNPLVIIGGLGGLAGLAFRDRYPWISRLGLPIFLSALVLNWIYLILFLPR